MAVGRPMGPLNLTDDELIKLQSLAGSCLLPHSIVQRAQIVLACASGDTNTIVAKRFGVRGSTEGKWRKRNLDLGLEGLDDELRPGRPRNYEDDKVAEVITQFKQCHRHQEFLGFLRQIEKSVPEDLDVHLVVDNYCTHKHAKVRSWLAQRPRFHVHFTPTYASWLN